MEREQIIKALECCVKSECNKCPLKDGRCANGEMGRLSLSLIKELNEEIERLTEELAKTYAALDESMNFYCSFAQSKIQNCPIDDEVAKAKADTVRKMQERLNDTKFKFDGTYYIYAENVDQIAKEMLEDGHR